MKHSGIRGKMNGNVAGTAVRAGAVLLLSLFLCFMMEDAASAKGKAYVAVFYRTFKDEEDPEAADVRAALNEALEDAGIAYREYDGEDNLLMQLMQIEQEKDAMVFIVNPSGQGLDDAEEDVGENTAADIVAQTDERPLIFFDCEISAETADMAEELCVLVNAAEPERMLAETEMTETETEAEDDPEPETETESESGPPEKNIRGMAEAIALIAGNYMTGAGYFEGIEEEWLTDGWRVDVPCCPAKADRQAAGREEGKLR